jgi:hypothetical protein
MKKLSQWLAVTAAAASLVLSTGNLSAQDNPPGGQGGERGGRGRGGQGGGNFDPSEFQARMMTNIREQMKVKDDTEWKAIEGLVQKVMDARREVGVGGGGFGRMFRRPGGDNAGGGGGGGRRGGGFGGEPSAEQTALDKAIDSNASKDELKSAMAKVRASKKDKEAKLTKSQEDLKKVLSTEQEAVALSMGLVQ